MNRLYKFLALCCVFGVIYPLLVILYGFHGDSSGRRSGSLIIPRKCYRQRLCRTHGEPADVQPLIRRVAFRQFS
jgi:hypothetical protein